MIPIKHCALTLALHALRDGRGDALLLLHELHGSSNEWRAAELDWPGPVYALDFCGHGASDALTGASYSAELFVADADHALDHLQCAVVAGRGIGAYVAVMLAGARPQAIPAALLLPGAGLVGGPPTPALSRPLLPSAHELTTASAGDPHAAIVEHLVRPPDYSAALAAEVRQLFLGEDGGERPPWWLVLRALPQAVRVAAEPAAAIAAMRAAIERDGAPSHSEK